MSKSLEPKMFIRPVVVLSLACSLVITASADMKSKKKMTMGTGQQGAARAFESASYVKGARERSEMNMMGFQTISITQCDLKRIVTLNEKNKTYMITPIGGEEQESASEPEATTPQPKATKPQPKTETPKGPGGVITITTNITDTGE